MESISCYVCVSACVFVSTSIQICININTINTALLHPKCEGEGEGKGEVMDKVKVRVNVNVSVKTKVKVKAKLI